ncbi:MAG: succinate--CoA ligase subunit alpha [Planctomycetota bacterium]|nr:MAG: succinate--CoA ligase subunit alpha [Planctomycetota bacterium]
MSILVNRDTRILIQNIGNFGEFHAKLTQGFGGAPVVAATKIGKGGTKIADVPVFETVEEAVRETGATASGVFVPAFAAADAIMEAADAGIKVIVVVTEGIPALDMVRAKEFAKSKGARIIGPNSPGVVVPEECRIGIAPVDIYRKGTVGVISRSGTLTYVGVNQVTELGHGQSTVIGIGGDPVPGTTFVDLLRLFEDDPETEGIMLIGEIGGSAEEEAAAFISEHVTKPVCAFIAGATAPPGKRMGHAGAVILRGKGTAASKIQAFEDTGKVAVAKLPSQIGETMITALRKKK